MSKNVNKNKTHFTRREIAGSEKARFLQQKIEWPSYTNSKSIVTNNLMSNRGITVENIE